MLRNFCRVSIVACAWLVLWLAAGCAKSGGKDTIDTTTIDTTGTPIAVTANCLSTVCQPPETKLEYESECDIEVDGSDRKIGSNDIPNHCVATDYQFDIKPQDFHFVLPTNPALAAETTWVTVCTKPPQRFGVALNGVVFDPEAIAIWDKDHNCIENLPITEVSCDEARWEADAGADLDDSLFCTHPTDGSSAALDMDTHKGHTQDGGLYHYHRLTACTAANIAGVSEAYLSTHMTLIGWAFDGFPVYWKYGQLTKGGDLIEMKSQYELTGALRSGLPGRRSVPLLRDFPLGTFVNDWGYRGGRTGDDVLDECNGKECYSPDLGRIIYCYFITEEYPYIPRCLRGAPHSF